MWLTGDIQKLQHRYQLQHGTGMRKEHVVRQSVKEQKNFSSGSILKISLADLSCNSL